MAGLQEHVIESERLIAGSGFADGRHCQPFENASVGAVQSTGSLTCRSGLTAAVTMENFGLKAPKWMINRHLPRADAPL
jgi:hypothetical protein